MSDDIRDCPECQRTERLCYRHEAAMMAQPTEKERRIADLESRLAAAERDRDEYDRQRSLYHANMMRVREQRDGAIAKLDELRAVPPTTQRERQLAQECERLRASMPALSFDEVNKLLSRAERAEAERATLERQLAEAKAERAQVLVDIDAVKRRASLDTAENIELKIERDQLRRELEEARAHVPNSVRELGLDLPNAISFLTQACQSGVAILMDAAKARDTALARVGELEEQLAHRVPDESPGNVIAANTKGMVVLDDGISTYNPLAACRWFANQVGNMAAHAAELDRKLDRDSTLAGSWADCIATLTHDLAQARERVAELENLNAQYKVRAEMAERGEAEANDIMSRGAGELLGLRAQLATVTRERDAARDNVARLESELRLTIEGTHTQCVPLEIARQYNGRVHDEAIEAEKARLRPVWELVERAMDNVSEQLRERSQHLDRIAAWEILDDALAAVKKELER